MAILQLITKVRRVNSSVMGSARSCRTHAEIPESRYPVRKPVFFGAALKDGTGPHQFTKASTVKWCPDSTIVDFDTSHWVLEEAPEQVNEELEKWFNGLEIKASRL